MSIIIYKQTTDEFAAFKGNEIKKLLETPGLKDRIGGAGNQFALMTIVSLMTSIPLMLLKNDFIYKFNHNSIVVVVFEAAFLVVIFVALLIQEQQQQQHAYNRVY